MALTQVDQGLLGSNAQYTGFKNRIINGGMQVAQRGTSTTTNFGVFVDMWRYSITGPSAISVAQSSTAPTGFSSSLLVTITTGAAIGSSLNYITQAIEGYNCADLGFGTAAASTVTISFWVRSSITGTFGGSLRNYAPASLYRGYPFTYTINSANTWEQKTITIAGDGVGGAGQWNTNNNGSLTVFFDLGTQSGYTAAANSWVSQNVVGATGTQTSLIATSGATFYITGVQLEKGSTATSFDYRPYGTELQLCQRYYQITRINGSSTTGLGLAAIYATTAAYCVYPLKVSMRSAPTGNVSAVNAMTVFANGAAYTSTGISTQAANTEQIEIVVQSTGMTAGQGGWIRFSGVNTWIDFSAEL